MPRRLKAMSETVVETPELTPDETSMFDAGNGATPVDGNGSLAAALAVYDPATLDVIITGDVVNEYVQAGFLQTTVEGYERDVQHVRAAIARSALGMVEAGELLASMKERTQHGSWGFLLTRIGLSTESAERCVAAWRAYTQYPALAAHVTAFAGSTLALIGQRKDITPAAIDAIAELAEAGEAERDMVLDIIRENAPAKEAKPAKHKTFFRLMSAHEAQSYRDGMIEVANRMTGAMANAGANLTGLAKSTDFKSWAKSVLSGGEEVSETQRALLGFMLAAYIAEHPDPETH